jgi:ATP-dependent DNA ligase
MRFPLEPPIKPMLAKVAEHLPEGGDYLFEPKWDGFRAIVFRGRADVYVQSRDLKPLDRFFPELRQPLLDSLPSGSVIDGEIVIATGHGLDFDALQLRLHPAQSRIAKLAHETPASFVAFDMLANAGKNVMAMSQERRRTHLERALAQATPPVYLTPATRERSLAANWLDRFEGAGLDGVVAKSVELPYQPGKRAMLKIKHIRTADCVVAGFRWYNASPGLVGSLLLGVYDDDDVLQHIGVTSAFTMQARAELANLLEPLRKNARLNHPWRNWEDIEAHAVSRMPGAQSRWTGSKDLSWEPLRIERVCEVKYDHLQGNRFRHAAHFVRWRPDKAPIDCRYDQLETVPPFELEKVFGGTMRAAPTLAV